MQTTDSLTPPAWLSTLGAPAAWLMGRLSLGRKLILLGLTGSLLGGLSALNLYLLLGHYLANRQWLATLTQDLPVTKGHVEYAPLQQHMVRSDREYARILERG